MSQPWTQIWQAVRQARRAAVAVVGVILILAGVVMLIIPGPGILTIVLGLALLATEFSWAHALLKRLQTRGRTLKARLQARWSKKKPAE